MARVKIVAGWVVAALVATTVGLELPVGAVDGRPVEPAREVAVRLGGDGETLVVGWELWRGAPGAYEGVDEWVVTAPGADEVVVPATAVRAEVEGLDVEETHVVTVTGRNLEGDGPPATGTFDPDLTPAGAVGELDVRPTAISGQLLVSWTPPVSEPVVDDVRITWPGGHEDVLATEPQGITIGNMTDGQPVVVTARARSADGWGPVAQALPMASGAPILAPPEVTAVATGQPGEIEVTWGAPTAGAEGLSPIDGFEVTWSGGGHLTVPGATSRTTTLTGLVDGQAYDVRVASRNGAGPGVRAMVADVVPSGPPTAAPAGLTAEGTGTSGEVQLDWADFDAAGDGGSDITAFRVEGAGEPFDVTTPEQALIEGLPDGEPIELSVRAVNANGAGPAATAGATPSGPPTAAPEWASLSARPGAGRFRIHWPAVTGAGTGGSPITGYEIEAGSVTHTAPADATEADVSGLTDGEATNVRLRAVNGNGPGPWVGTWQITTGVPTGPVDVVVRTVGETSARVTWDPLPTDEQGTSPIEAYRVVWFDAAWQHHEVVLEATDDELLIEDLVPGTTYNPTVSARNAHGWGAYASQSIVAGRPSVAPADVVVESTGNANELEVTWTVPAEGLGTATTVVIRNASTGVAVEVPVSATSAVVGAQRWGWNQYHVWFRSPHGDGPWSPMTEHVAASSPPPYPPTVDVAPRSGELVVGWQGVWDDGGSPLTGYEVSWESASGSGSEVVGPETFAFTIEDLADGEAVSVTVAAVNRHGAGAASEPIVRAPGQLPEALPGELTVESTGQPGQVEVSWPGLETGQWGTGATREYLVSWGDESLRVPAGTTTHLIDGLALETSLLITVRAVTEVGPGTERGQWIWVGSPPTDPPTGVVARPSATPGRAVVEWSPSGGKRFEADPGYGWVVTWPGGSRTVASTVSRVELSGLPTDVPLTFQVQARNPYGLGPASAPTRAIRADGLAPRPNLLATADVGEHNGIGWVGVQTELTRSDEVAESGRASLRVELTSAGGDGPMVLADGGTGGTPVTPGQEYVASVWVQATGVEGPRKAAATILWFGADGEIVGEDEGGDLVEDLGGTWTELATTAVAPEGAATGLLFVMFGGNEAGDVFHLDGAVLAEAEEGAPNLLTEVQSGFETGSLGWTAAYGRTSRSDDVGGHEGWTSLRVELDGRHDAGAGETATVTADPVALGALGADRTVAAAAWARARGTASEASTALTFLDAEGAVLETVAGTPVAIGPGGWTKATVSTTAPAGATHVLVSVGLSGAAGDVRHVDDIAVRVGPPATPGPNLLAAPTAGLESDELGWLGSDSTVGANIETARHGLVSMTITGRGSAGATTDLGTAGVPVTPHHQYTASVWAMGWDTPRATRTRITWYDATGAVLDDAVGDPVTEAENDWRQAWVTAVAPTGAAFASMAVTFAGAVPGEIHSLDDVAFCRGSSPDCLADTPPAVRPGGVAISDEGEGEVLTWTLDPADRTAEGVTGYLVTWDGGQLEVTDPAATSTVLDGVGPEVRTVSVAAVNAHGVGPAARGTRPGPPTAAPGELFAAGTGTNGQIEVDWAALDPEDDGGSPVTGYRVQIEGNSSWYRDVTGTEVVQGGFVDGRPETFVVRARNAFGLGPAATARATSYGAPQPLYGITAQPTGAAGEVQVTWSPRAEPAGAAPITGYEVRVGDQRSTEAPAARSLLVGGLADGVQVRVVVRAVNEHGPGPWSAANVVPGIPAGAVTDLRTESVSPTAQRVRWTPLAGPQLGAGPLTRQIVRRQTLTSGYYLGVATDVEVAPGTGEVALDGLTAGQDYRVTVWSVNAHGAAPTATVDFRAGRPTARPASVTATATGQPGQAQVSWTLPAEGLGAATGIVVTRQGGGSVVLPLDVSSTVLQGLSVGSSSYVSVAVRSPHGDGPAWGPVSVVSSGPPTGAPSGVWVEPKGSGLEVDWSQVYQTGGSPLTGYLVTWESSTGSGQQLVPYFTLRYLIPDLDHDVEWSVTVRAVNRWGEGPVSEPVVGTPGTRPGGSSTTLRALPTGVPGEFLVSWSPLPESQWGSGDDRRYVVGSWPTSMVEVPGDQTSVVVSGIPPGGQYLQLWARTDVGDGYPYAYVEAKRGVLPRVVAVDVVGRPAGTPGRATVEWSTQYPLAYLPPAEVTGWVVAWPGGSVQVPAEARTATIEGLSPTTPVRFTVRAENAEGLGQESPADRSIVPDGSTRRPDLLPPSRLNTSPLGWASPQVLLSRSGEQAESGRSSLRMELRADEIQVIATGDAGGLPVSGGATYAMSAWMRAEDGETLDAVIAFAWLDAAGRFVAQPDPTGWIAVGDEWTEVSASVTAPASAATMLPLAWVKGARGMVAHLDGAVVALDDPAAPNLLSEAHSGFEHGALGWTTRGTRISRSSAVGGHEGLTALRVELDGRTVEELASIGTDPLALPALAPDRLVSGSLWVRAPEGGQAHPTLAFLDADGVVLDTTLGSAAAVGDAWSELAISAVAPAGATAVVVGAAFDGAAGAVRYLDDVVIGPGATPTAGSDLLAAAPSGFETDGLGWFGQRGRVGVDFILARDGFLAMSIEATGRGPAATTDLGTAGVPVQADRQYSASVWTFKVDGSDRSTRATITWYDATGARLGESPGEEVVGDDAWWTEVSVTAVAPPGAAFASLAASFPDGRAGEFFGVDDPSFCAGPDVDCQPQTAPGVKVSGLTAVPGSVPGTVDVSWTLDPAVRAEERVEGFDVRWDDGIEEVDDPTATSVTLTGITGSGPVELEVRAANAYGLGPVATTTVAVTVPGAPPEAPQGVMAVPAPGGGVDVTWAPPSPSAGTITGYVVRYAPGWDMVVDVPAPATGVHVPGWDGMAQISVAARNSAGRGPASPVQLVDLSGACPPPTRSGHDQVVLADEPAAFFAEPGYDPTTWEPFVYDEVTCTRGEREPGASSTSNHQLWWSDAFWATGRGGRIVLPLDGLTDDLASVEMWVDAGNVVDLEVPGGRLRLVDGQDADGIQVVPDDGDWHHLVLTADGDELRATVDGEAVVVGDDPWALAWDPEQQDQGVIRLVQGGFDQVALYTEPLSGAAIARHRAAAGLQETGTTLEVPVGEPSATAPTSMAVQVASDWDYPTGDAVLLDDGVEIAREALGPEGGATFSVVLGTGNHDLIAVYEGSATHVASRSVRTLRTEGGEATVTEIELGAATGPYGSSTTVDVTVTDADADPVAGPVEVWVDGRLHHAVTADSSGEVSATLRPLTPGPHVVTAVHRGATGLRPSMATDRWTVTPAEVEPESTPGELEFTLPAVDGGTAPTGWVAVKLDGDQVGSAHLDPAIDAEGRLVSEARLTSAAIGAEAGTHQLEVVYSGDVRHRSTSWDHSYEVGHSVVLTGPESAEVEQSIPLTAHVRTNGLPANGWGELWLDGEHYNSFTVSNGEAEASVWLSAAGGHEVSFRYNGTESAPIEIVAGRATRVEVATYGAVRGTPLEGSVGRVDGSGIVGQGWVSVGPAADGSEPERVPVNGWGGFSLPTDHLAPGSEVRVTYTPPTATPTAAQPFLGSRSEPFALGRTPSVIEVAGIPSGVVDGTTLSVEVTVTAGAPAQGEITASWGGGDPVASAGLDLDGRATVEVTVPGPGVHQLRLDYLGSTVAAPEVLEVPVSVHEVVEPSVRILADPSASTDVGADLDAKVIVTNPPSINASRPTGDVELTVDGVVVGTTEVSPGAAGQAQAVFALDPASALGALGRRGPHVVRARYLGDEVHRPSRAEIGIRRTEPVTVTIVDPPATSPYGNPPTIEAVVEAADGTVPRGGELVLRIAESGSYEAEYRRVPVDQDGATTLTVGYWLDLGRHDVRVTYTGDDTFRHASSVEIDHLVTAAPTSVALTTTTSPVVARGPLVLRAAVTTPPSPLGSSQHRSGVVTFRAGSTVLGTASTSGSVATLTTTAPATAGPTTFTATYAGFAYYASSMGSLEVAVGDAVTTTTVSPQERPAEIGEAIELLATVKTGAEVVADVPVVFSEGTTTLGTATTDEDGIARLEVQLPAGPHQIRAAFAGAPSLAASSAAALTYWVARRTTMTVTPLTGALTYGQAARYRVAVAYETGGGYPLGQVRLEAGTTLGLSVPLGVDGTAEVSMKLGTGRWSAKVAYSGTNQVPPSASEPFDVIVARAVLEQRPLTVQPPQVTWGSPVTVTARVVPIAGVPITGVMTLHDTDGTQLGGRQWVNDAGQVRFTVSGRTLGVGVHHLTARYGGTTDYAPTESASFPVTVSVAHPVIDVDAPAALRDEGIAEIDLRVASPGEINAEGDVELWSVPTSGPGTLLDTATLDEGEARFLCSAAGASTTHPCGGLASGTHRFKVVFPESWEGIAAGESDVFSIVVQPASAAEVTWRSPPVIGYTGRFVSVAVEVEGPGERIPEGTVTILGPGGVALGTNGVDEDGFATVRFTTATPGDLELVASYSGDEILGPQLSVPHTIEIRESIAIVMTTPARTFVAGSTSEVVTLELRRPDGSPYVAPAGGVPLDLGSSSRSTVFTSAQQVDTDTVLVPAGQSSVSLTLANTSANAHQLTARSETIGVTTWQTFPFTVTRAAQAYIVPVPGEVSAAVGQPARRIRVVASDAYGNSHGDLTSGLTFTTPGGTCTTDGVCTPTVPGDHTVTITHGSFTTSVVLHANTPPTAEIVGAPTPSPTNARRLTFTLKAGDADGHPLTWIVHWGDGSGSTQVKSLSETERAPDGTWTVTHDFAAHTTAEVVFQVTDGKALAYDSERIVKVEDLTPVADAGDDQVAQVATAVAFDGSNSLPRTAALRYRWDFGDGSEDSTEQAPSHVYGQPGQYLVTLVVAHGTTMSSASTAIVTVTGATGSGVFVDVLHNGQPVAGAAVVVNTADDIAHRGVAQPGNAGRYVLAGLPLGQHTAYVYRDGFAPAAVGFVVTGGVDTLSVDLVPGAAARATLTTRRLSHTEAVELGIITQNTDAEVIHQFDVWLPNRRRPVTLYQDSRGRSLCPSDPDEDLIDDETGEPLPQPVGSDCGELTIPDIGGGGGGSSLRMKDNTVVVMNKTRATWAKEVFEATLQVFNISPDGFTLVNGVATLNLPGQGLALAEMVTGEQSAVVGLNSIAAGQSQSVSWYLRGDNEGYYDLSADVTAVLDPVGIPISVRAETDDENRIHVWGTSAVQASLETDATVEADTPFRQRVTVTNVADVPIYNVLVGLDTGRASGHVEVLAQPRQADALHLGELPAGEQARSPEARLLFTAEQAAEGDRLASYQFVDTSVGRVPFAVSRHDDLERLPAPVIVAGEGGTALDGATLSWEPVDGALGYAVFTTSSRTRAFPADPIAATDDGDDTSVVLPPQGGYGVVAVTALVDRKGTGPADDVYAMSHRLLEAGTLAPEPDPYGVRLDDPCRGFGTDPTVAYPGNLAFGRTDLAVPSVGLPLAIRRTYNSLDPRDGGGGAGWNVDLGPRLVTDQDGNAALILGDGSCRPVRENPSTPGTLEVFGRSERWQAEIVPNSGGEIRLTDLTARITYRLDAEGRTVWAENAQEHRTLYDYDGEATRPDTITDESSGRALHLSWTDGDQLRTVATDPVTPAPGQPAAPIQWTYHHDAEGRLTLACAPGAACELYQYDAQGRVAKVIDRDYTITSIVYDDQGRMQRLTRPASGVTSFAYAGDGGRQVTTTDPRGAVTVASFDETYRLTASDGPDGESAVGYDAHGYVDSVTAKGQEVTMTSTPNGVPLSMTSPLGTTTYGHDLQGNISTVTGPRGLGSTTVYDTSDRPTSQTIPATSLAPALTTSWSYSAQGPGRTRTTAAIGGGTVPWGLVIEERVPVPTPWAASAGVTTYRYDAQGNAVRTELPTDAVITATYDELGRRTSHTTTAPGLPTATTTYTYDDRGNVLTSTGPVTTDALTGEAHQVRTTTTYDREGRPTKVVEDDIAGSTPTRQRSVTYDGRGRVLTESVQIDASRAAVTRHRYDAAGNEVETVDAEGTVTRRTFDPAGRVLTEQVDGVVVATTAYDADTGRVTQTTDALNRTTTYAYDGVAGSCSGSGRPSIWERALPATWCSSTEATTAPATWSPGSSTAACGAPTTPTTPWAGSPPRSTTPPASTGPPSTGTTRPATGRPSGAPAAARPRRSPPSTTATGGSSSRSSTTAPPTWSRPSPTTPSAG